MKITLLVLTTLTIASADTLWLRRYDAGNLEYATCVACDGRQVVVGGNRIAPNHQFEWLILWYGHDGQLVRARTYDPGPYPYDYIGDIALDASGGAIVAGESFVVDCGAHILPPDWRMGQGVRHLADGLDGILLKLDTLGDVVWCSTLPGFWLSGVTIDAGGGCFLSCGRWGSLGYDLAIARFGPDGESLWTRTLDVSTEWHPGGRIAVDGRGGLVQATTTGRDTQAVCLTVCWDSLGDTLWTRRYRNHLCAHGDGVAVDRFGDIYVAGSAGIDTVGGVSPLLIKYSPAGELLWERTLDLGEPAQWVSVATADNAVVVSGEVTPGNPRDDYLTALYNFDGDTLWTARCDGGDIDAGSDAAVDLFGNPVVAGRCSNDFGTIKYALTSSVAEARIPVAARPLPTATVARGVLNLVSDITHRSSDIVLLDAAGRRVMQLRAGPNDLSALAPGVYFVHAGGAPTGKVALAR